MLTQIDVDPREHLDFSLAWRKRAPSNDQETATLTEAGTVMLGDPGAGPFGLSVIISRKESNDAPTN